MTFYTLYDCYTDNDLANLPPSREYVRTSPERRIIDGLTCVPWRTVEADTERHALQLAGCFVRRIGAPHPSLRAVEVTDPDPRTVTRFDGPEITGGVVLIGGTGGVPVPNARLLDCGSILVEWLDTRGTRVYGSGDWRYADERPAAYSTQGIVGRTGYSVRRASDGCLADYPDLASAEQAAASLLSGETADDAVDWRQPW